MLRKKHWTGEVHEHGGRDGRQAISASDGIRRDQGDHRRSEVRVRDDVEERHQVCGRIWWTQFRTSIASFKSDRKS